MIKTETEILAMLKRYDPQAQDYYTEWADGTIVSYDSIVRRAVPSAEWPIVEYEGSYQGDCYMIGKDESHWYFFSHSFGSCSGCDALESDARKAIPNVLKCIREFETKDTLLEYARKFDWTSGWRSEGEESFESKMIKRIEAL